MHVHLVMGILISGRTGDHPLHELACRPAPTPPSELYKLQTLVHSSWRYPRAALAAEPQQEAGGSGAPDLAAGAVAAAATSAAPQPADAAQQSPDGAADEVRDQAAPSPAAADRNGTPHASSSALQQQPGATALREGDPAAATASPREPQRLRTPGLQQPGAERQQSVLTDLTALLARLVRTMRSEQEVCEEDAREEQAVSRLVAALADELPGPTARRALDLLALGWWDDPAGALGRARRVVVCNAAGMRYGARMCNTHAHA